MSFGKNPFSLVAEAHHEMGSPGLQECLRELGNNYDDLEPKLQEAYDAFYDELLEFAASQGQG